MKYLIAFYVGDNKRRGKVAKACLKVGFRVQKSVFETFMDREQLDRFESHISSTIKMDCDVPWRRLLRLRVEQMRRVILEGSTIEPLEWEESYDICAQEYLKKHIFQYVEPRV